MDIEHPDIARIRRTGSVRKAIEEPEYCGLDYFNEPIYENEEIIQDGDDTILKHNLERYLSEVYGMQFQTIK